MPASARLTPRRLALKPPAGTPLLAASSLAAGLVAHWGMNDAEGTRLANLGRIDAPATASGATWAWRAQQAPLFQCPTFPGNTTDYLTVPHQTALAPTNKSVAVWFFLTANPAAFQTLVNKGLDYILRIDTNHTIGWYVWTGGIVRTVTGGLAIPVGVPFFAVGTWDGTTMRIYQQGRQAGVASPGNVTTTGTSVLTFGGDSLAADSLYGALGMVTLWDRALTAAEVMQLYVDPFALFARPRALLTGPPVAATGGGGAGTGQAAIDVGHRRRGPGPVLG